MNLETKIVEVLKKSFIYCINNSFRSYDHFDALNSPLGNLIKSKYLKRLFLQLLSRSPINFRPIIGVKKSVIPKTISDLLSAAIKLKNISCEIKEISINNLKNLLIEMSIGGYSGKCWGLPFEFVSRNGIMKKNTPNVITTYYAVSALLDLYEAYKDENVLKICKESVDFFINDIGYCEINDSLFFGYYPGNIHPIHNSNLLVSSLLSRIGKLTLNDSLLQIGEKGMKFSANSQRKDGSWVYGEEPNLQWIDNFHTGYNLEAMYLYRKYAENSKFDSQIVNGYNYYINNMFTKKGIPKYYNTRNYPVDSQTIAQSILTLTLFSDFNVNSEIILNNILKYTINNFYNSEGFFYFRRYPHYAIKINYLRWSTSPMILALTNYLEKCLKY